MTIVAAVAATVHLAVATRYGWFPDEFYFVICGRHPAWGYVDQPPLVPLLTRVAEALPGVEVDLSDPQEPDFDEYEDEPEYFYYSAVSE